MTCIPPTRSPCASIAFVQLNVEWRRVCVRVSRAAIRGTNLLPDQGWIDRTGWPNEPGQDVDPNSACRAPSVRVSTGRPIAGGVVAVQWRSRRSASASTGSCRPGPWSVIWAPPVPCQVVPGAQFDQQDFHLVIGQSLRIAVENGVEERQTRQAADWVISCCLSWPRVSATADHAGLRPTGMVCGSHG